ncbi:hypothetical protein [Aliivibrio kagoshimensis]|uniref:hypothetical protein n=1 Tax=Aliivibrio kagoshimensis TaxID=2910230 RepID=UPI003D0D4E24
MLADTLARVDKLRKKAMADAEFLQSAKDHEQAIQQSSATPKVNEKRQHKDKKLADIYQKSNFGNNPSGTQH